MCLKKSLIFFVGLEHFNNELVFKILKKISFQPSTIFEVINGPLTRVASTTLDLCDRSSLGQRIVSIEHAV